MELRSPDLVKILIVDDKKENLLSLQVILDGQGYEFVEAYSGKDALRILLKDQNFAIILMDVQMPLMDGFETAELIRQSEKLKHVPIIFLTANMNSADYIFKGYQAGAVDYMIKPLSPEILKAKVSVFADLFRKNYELRVKEEETNLLNAAIITANQELEARYNEIEKFAAELQVKNTELDAFAYISSHDLQEPLRKIQTFSKMILENEYDRLSDYGKTRFDRILQSASRMRDLITSLLAFSRMSVGEREFEQVDIRTLVDEVKDVLSENMLEKQVSISTDIESTVTVIPFQFMQLLQNLISNSIKFSQPGVAPHITIRHSIIQSPLESYDYLDPGRKYNRIVIQDNGIGFEQQHSDRIFGVFQKLHEKTRYEGTGIGLAIVKKVVENHNGHISASGQLMKGARFEIVIPEP